MGFEVIKRPIKAPKGVVLGAGTIGSTEVAALAITAAKLANALDLSTRTLTGSYRERVVTASTSTATADITAPLSGFYICNNSTSTAAGFSKTYQLAAPTAGDRAMFVVKTFSTSTGTDNVKIKLSSTGAVKFQDGTNYVATLNAANEGFEMVALSTAVWLVISELPMAAAASTGPSYGTS